MIKERIEKLGSYFKQMQTAVAENGQQLIYVITSFPKNWVVDDYEIADKFSVAVQKGNVQNEYYFCTDLETGEDAIFDAIDYNIEKMQNAIERANLLTAKTKELKEIFENEEISLDQLRTLTFSYEENAVSPETPLITTKKRGRPRNNDNEDEKEE